MSRYINADEFAKQAYEVAYPIVHDNNSHERGLTLMGIAQLLDEQPTADVVEVVRCKECKHYNNNKKLYNDDVCEILYYCDGIHRTVCEQDYCSYGERKEA